MACYLLGIESQSELERSPFLGPLFEGFVAAEILKSQVNRGERKELYFFRDQQALEVDFIIPQPNAGLWLIEAKASKTVRPAMAAPVLSLQRALADRAKRLTVVHRKSNASTATSAIAPGVEALDMEQMVADLNRRK
jgi:predicted AAA+ superfamily ATPase